MAKTSTRLQNVKEGSAATAGFRDGGDSIFKQVQDQDNNSKAPILVPGGASNGGYLDVVRHFRWTPTELGDAAYDDIPYIVLREFRSTRSGLDLISQGAKFTAAIGTGTDPYDGLYSFDDPTNFVYRFPYFSSSYYDISNSFQNVNPADLAKGLLSGGKDMLKDLSALKNSKSKIGQAIGGIAGLGNDLAAGIEKIASSGESLAQIKNSATGAAGGNDIGKLDQPMLWSNTNARTTSFKFYLFNTFSSTDIKRNWELIHLLRYQNVINKRSIVQCTPPVFYEIRIPGQHYMPGAYMSGFDVRNVGTVRRLDGEEAGGLSLPTVHVPDAWEVSITLTDFLKPSQNLLHDLLEDASVVTSKSGSVGSKGTTTVNKK